MKAAILGVSGYTGQLLLRILLDHPGITEIIPVSTSKQGKSLSIIDPGLGCRSLEKVQATAEKAVSIKKALNYKVDVVFAALPHLKSAELYAPFLGKAVIIDLSADLRIKDALLFKQAYGVRPPRQDLLEQAVYGLCEWYNKDIKGTDIIANPGCYTTASLLPLLPLCKQGIVKDHIIINAVSGISGAGKKVKEYLLFCERTENVGAYSPGRTHRHALEIEAELNMINKDFSLLFTPHLAPLCRGIATTIVVQSTKEISVQELMDIYQQYYGTFPFIGLRGEVIPQTKEVWGSNRCDIGWHIEEDMVMIFSVIDNLIKGAAGQAVQNMNIRFGIDETTGLKVHNEL